MQILRAMELSEEKLTALIYGAPGMGKTTLLGTLPGRTLIVDVDKGTSVLRGTSTADIIRLSEDLHEMPEVLKELQSVHRQPFGTGARNVSVFRQNRKTGRSARLASLQSYRLQNNRPVQAVQSIGEQHNIHGVGISERDNSSDRGKIFTGTSNAEREEYRQCMRTM